MRYKLTPDLETGNKMIDSEHRELLDAVNKLMDSFAQGQGRTAIDPAVKFLLDYVRTHFAHEEQLQERSKYPGINEHKQFHTSYTNTLRDIVSELPEKHGVAEVRKISAHTQLLINHIRTEDKRLAAHLKQNS